MLHRMSKGVKLCNQGLRHVCRNYPENRRFVKYIVSVMTRLLNLIIIYQRPCTPGQNVRVTASENTLSKKLLTPTGGKKFRMYIDIRHFRCDNYTIIMSNYWRGEIVP